MAKAQGKKAAAARSKGVAKKVVARVTKAVQAGGKKAKAAVKKPVAKVVKARPVTKPKASPKGKPAAKPVKPKQAVKAKAAPKAASRPAPKASPRSASKPAPKPAPKPSKAPARTVPAPPPVKVKAEPPAAAGKGRAAAAPKGPAAKSAVAKPPAAAAAPAAPRPAAAKAAEPEKKRGRRPRPRVHSNGVPVAAWLSTEKPRSASFIPAPPRAEAPSAVAAPPASSDRLIRPDDLEHPAVRTVPVRIDIEQGAGRFYVIASPIEVFLRVGEGIEWDFRYIGGADVSAEEVVVEFDRPSPFAHLTFRTRKPGGARPHRQLSGAALPAAAGKRVEYRVRAISGYKTDLASTTIWVTITP